MFFPAAQLIFSLLFHEIVAYHHHPKPKYCKYRTKDSYNNTYYYKTTICHNSWCCSNGCCPFYINLTICVFVVVIIFCIIKIIQVCWSKYCSKEEKTNVDNQPEDIYMTSRTHLNNAYSGESIFQNYGSNQVVPSAPPFGKTSDQVPTYEEAVSAKCQSN